MLSRGISWVVICLVSCVARCLGRHLDEILTFDRNTPLLQLGLCAVTIQFHKLTLLRDAWNQLLFRLGLPLNLQVAAIEHLSVKLSLCGALRVDIRGLCLLLTPGEVYSVGTKRAIERRLAWKESQLAKIEKEEEEKDKKRVGLNASVSTSPRWLRRQLTKLKNCVLFSLIQRLQVTVESVHVRIEDKLSSPGDSLAIGLTLRHLSVKENKEKGRVREEGSTKEIELKDTAIYLNPHTSDLLINTSTDETVVRMQAIPFTEAVGYSYTLRPTGAMATLQVQRGTRSIMDVLLSAELEAVRLRLSKEQLKSIVGFLGYLQLLLTPRRPFPVHRPTTPVDGHARQWWEYAFRTVTEQMELTQEYEEKYETLLVSDRSTKELQKAVKTLELGMSLPDLVFSRKRVRQRLKIRRLMDNLAHHLARMKTGAQVTRQIITPQPFLTTSLEFSILNSELQVVEDEEMMEVDILSASVTGIRVGLLQQPQELSVSASVRSANCVGFARAKESSPVIMTVWNQTVLRSTAPEPLLTTELKVYTQKAQTDSEFDYRVFATLQPSVFIFHKETFLKLAQVASIFLSSNESLKYAAKETAFEIKYYGRKEVKRAVKERKTLELCMDLSLPKIVLPEDGNTSSSDKLVTLHPGHLEVKSSVEMDQRQTLVQYRVVLSGSALSMAHNGPTFDWKEALISEATVSTPGEVFSCKHVNFTATFTADSAEGGSSPTTQLEADIPCVNVKLSNTLLEDGTEFAAEQLKTIDKLLDALTPSEEERRKKSSKKHFSPIGTSSAVVPSAERVLADVKNMTRQKSRLPGHGFNYLTATTRMDSTDFTDQGTEVGEQILMTFVCRVEEVCVSVSECERDQMKEYLLVNVRGLSSRSEVKEDCMCCELWVRSLELKDLSSRNGSPLIVIATNQDFLHIKALFADNSEEEIKAVCIAKTDVFVKLGSCVVSLSDESLLHLMTFVVGLQVQDPLTEILDLRNGSSESAEVSHCPSLRKDQLSVSHRNDGLINLRVRFELGRLVVAMIQPLTDVSISGIDAVLCDTSDKVKVSLKVDTVTITDHLQLQQESTYQQVVTTRKNFLNVETTLIKDMSASGPNADPKLVISITTGPLTTIVLYRFIRTVQLFTVQLVQELLRTWNNLRGQWAKLLDGTAQPTMQPSGPPLKYHATIDISAITLVLPRCSSSFEQVQLQLQHIYISNSYTYREIVEPIEMMTGALETDAVLHEKFSIRCDKLIISRCGLAGRAKSDVAVTDSFTSTFTRVMQLQLLTTGQYLGPKFAVEVHFGEVEAKISNEELCILPVHINDNLSEKVPSGLQFCTTSSNGSSPTVESLNKTPNPPSSHKGIELLHVAFSLKNLRCNLLLVKEPALWAPEPEGEGEGAVSYQSVCQVDLLQLSADLSYNVQSDFRASLQLEEWLVLEGTKQLRVISHTFKHDGKRRTPFLRTLISITSQGGINVTTCLKHVHACIWPSLALNLLELATTSVPQFSTQSIPEEGNESSGDEGSTRTTVVESGGVTADQTNKRRLPVVRLDIDCMSLAVLESPPETDVMVYGICAEVHSRKRKQPGLRVDFKEASVQGVEDTPKEESYPLKASLWMEVNICTIGEKIVTLTQVLDPCHFDASVVWSGTEEKTQISASTVVAFVTSEAIQVATKVIKECSKGLGQDQSRESSASLEETPAEIGNIWEIKEIDREALLATVTTAEENLPPAGVRNEAVRPPKNQEVSLSLPEVVINYDVIYAGDSNSMLSLTTAIEAKVKSWSDDLNFDGVLKAEAFIYNRRVATWEPLLEPIEDLNNECYRPWDTVIKVRQVDGSPGKDTPSVVNTEISPRRTDSVDSVSYEREGRTEGERPQKSMVVIVTSDDRLELTVSPGAIETLQEIVDTLSLDDPTIRNHLASCIKHTRSPMQVQNKTGSHLVLYPGPTFKLGSMGSSFSNPVAIPPGAITGGSSCLRFESIESEAQFQSLSGEMQFRRLSSEMMSLVPQSEEGNWDVSLDVGVMGTIQEEATDGDQVPDSSINLAYNSADQISCYSYDGIPGKLGSVEEETDGDDGGIGVVELGPHTVSGSISGKPLLRKRVEWKPKSLSNNHKMCIKAPGATVISSPISVSMPGSTPFPISNQISGIKQGKREAAYGICEVKVIQGVRKVTLRSALQVKNELCVVMSLFIGEVNAAVLLAEVDQGATYDVPLWMVTSQFPLRIGAGAGGHFCKDEVNWRKLIKDKKPVILACPESTLEADCFHVQVELSSSQVLNRRWQTDTEAYVIVLKPAFTLQNVLPMPIEIYLKETPSVEPSDVSPGELEHIYRVDPRSHHTLVVQLHDYKDLKWIGEVGIDLGSQGETRVKLHGFDADEQQVDRMNLGLLYDPKQSSLVQIYCPYWLVNKTGLDLEYEHHPSWLHKSVRTFDSGTEGPPALIYFKPDIEEKKRKLKVRVSGGRWSEALALGVTGKADTLVTFGSSGQLFELGLQSHISRNALTRIIHILPKHMLLNRTTIPLSIIACSSSADSEQAVFQPDKLTPFWSGKSTHAVKGRSHSGTFFQTQSFSLEELSTTVLATNLDSELSGLCVEVQPAPSECCELVTISPYIKGRAPIRVDNLCRKLTIIYAQQGSGHHYALQPSQSKLYTWDNLLGKKTLGWQVAGEKNSMWTFVENEGNSLGCRKVKITSGDAEEEFVCRWVVALDDSQRVIRFLDDLGDYKRFLQLDMPPQDDDLFELFCSMEGVGISIVNSAPVEVAYCCILSSPAVWRQRRPNGKWRVIEDPKKSVVLEAKWRTGHDVELDGETYDLSAMHIQGKKGIKILLSRTFNPGVWVELTVSSQTYSLSVKLGKMQIDNQLQDYDLSSRIVFGEEKLMDASKVIAPVLDAMVVMRKPEKGRKFLVFEKAYIQLKPMQVNLELGLVAALVSFVEPLLQDRLATDFEHDLKWMDKSTADILHIDEIAHRKTETHFGKLQLAPITCAVTYTTAGDYDLSSILGRILDSIVHLALITKGSFNINLSALEFTNKTLDLQQLLRIIIGHYKNDVLFQLHEVAFGLDIIGNPARLLRTFEVGAKDFVSEAEKGLEGERLGAGVAGIAVGVKDLLGHVIAGSAEAGTSTTGSFRNTLLAATDIDYRKKHRHLTQTTGESTGKFLLGTRFFAEGLFHGITDIFVKPITGAEREGVPGFFGGIGSGALSILTKPTLGVLDLAHFTLEGIRSAASDDPENQPVRLTRFIQHDRIITPFNIHKAEGQHILWLMKDHNNEGYYGHEWLPTKDKGQEPTALLVSSLHLLQVRRDGEHFEVDKWMISMKHVKSWTIKEGTQLQVRYDDESLLEKIGSFFSQHDDSTKIRTFCQISGNEAEYLEERITEAWEEYQSQHQTFH